MVLTRHLSSKKLLNQQWQSTVTARFPCGNSVEQFNSHSLQKGVRLPKGPHGIEEPRHQSQKTQTFFKSILTAEKQTSQRSTIHTTSHSVAFHCRCFPFLLICTPHKQLKSKSVQQNVCLPRHSSLLPLWRIAVLLLISDFSQVRSHHHTNSPCFIWQV